MRQQQPKELDESQFLQNNTRLKKKNKSQSRRGCVLLILLQVVPLSSQDHHLHRKKEILFISIYPPFQYMCYFTVNTNPTILCNSRKWRSLPSPCSISTPTAIYLLSLCRYCYNGVQEQAFPNCHELLTRKKEKNNTFVPLHRGLICKFKNQTDI